MTARGAILQRLVVEWLLKTAVGDRQVNLVKIPCHLEIGIPTFCPSLQVHEKCFPGGDFS